MSEEKAPPTAQQLLAALLAEEKKQTAALDDIQERLEDNERLWRRTSREVDIAFWIFVGIPLVAIGLWLCAALGGGLALFGG